MISGQERRVIEKVAWQGEIQPHMMIFVEIFWRGVVTSYLYDGWNNLTNTAYSDGTRPMSFAYDDIGNRLSSLDLGTNRTCVANNLNRCTNIANGSDSFAPQYDLNMRLRRRRRVARRSAATEPRSGRKRPRNKNVSDVVSFQQARGVPAHYEYAPFGEVTVSATNTAFTAFNVATTNPYRFSSEYADDALGLVYYNYRHYDPVCGRWGRMDAIAENGSINLYSIVGNDVVCNNDILGLKWKILRDGGMFATAIPGADDDTFETLARELGLDFSDYTKWAHTNDTTPTKCKEYYIPNVKVYHKGCRRFYENWPNCVIG